MPGDMILYHLARRHQNARPLQVSWQMRACVRTLWRAVSGRLSTLRNSFDMWGLDFMVGSDWRVWLIEVNSNPALHTPAKCPVLRRVLPSVVADTLDTVLALHGHGSVDAAASVDSRWLDVAVPEDGLVAELRRSRAGSGGDTARGEEA